MFVFSLLFVLSSKAAASLHPTTSPLQNNTFICGVTRNFTAANGYIKSPGYPVRYPSSTFCTYDIHVGWGLRIELTWKDFDIDGDMPECSSANCDYVEAFTGCKENRRFLARFCSRNSVAPHPLYSVDNCMSLHFFARPVELAKTSKGFLAEYKAVNKSKPMAYQKCNRTLGERSGIIHSTFWPRTYLFENWDICNWHLKTDPTAAVQFTVMDLSTYSAYGQCNADYGSHDGVVIQGIGSLYRSTQSWKEFFGSCKPFSYRTLYNELVINWRINSHYAYNCRGFIIGYVSYRPIDRNMAIWQYALLAVAAALVVYFSLLFSCRQFISKRLAKRRHYRRLVDMDSSSDDIPMGNNQENNEIAEPHDGGSTHTDTDVDAQSPEPPFENEIQVNHYQDVSASDLSSCVNTEELDSVRMRNIRNIDSHSHDFLPHNNLRVEAIFHPLPPSARQQVFPNQTHDYTDGANSADNDEDLLRQQAVVTDPSTTFLPQVSVAPGYLSPTVVSPTAAAPPSSTPAHLPQTLVPSTLAPQTSSNEPGPLECERYPPGLDGFTGQQPRHKDNAGYVDDEKPQQDSISIDTENARSHDSGQASDSTTMLPPSYETIYEELQSLSRIVAEIVSDIE